MNMHIFKKNIFTAIILCGCYSFSACSSEIEHGTTDIDTWPLAPIDVNYIPTLEHPGILHTNTDIEQLQKIIETKQGPAYNCYELLAGHALSRSDYNMEGPFSDIYRGNDGVRPVIQSKYENDFNAAYQNSIMYAVTREEAYAKKATEILIAYANTLQTISGNDIPLLAGIMGVKFMYAAEMMRYLYPQGMTDEHFTKVCAMFKSIFVPVLEEFYDTPPYTNGNWGTAVTMSYIAASILLNDAEMYKKAIDFYLYGTDNGNIRHYVDGETGQCQESGRDQAHTQLGLECLAVTCEIAYKQGTDLYGVMDNRLLKGYEYTAKYNLGYDDVPFKQWTDITGKYNNWKEISAEKRGEFRPVYEKVYNHYVNRLGLDMPYTKQVLDKIRPEGYYYEHLGFGTFLFNESEL